MKKIEMIWREILFKSIERRHPPSGEASRLFTQKELAKHLGVSTSTIFQSLKTPRKMGAVKVTGRFFTLEDTEKLLYHWASVRDLQKDIIFTGHVDLPVFEIEGLMPPDAVFACYSAARYYLTVPPADYDKVYIYAKDVKEISERFSFKRGRSNIIVLRADPLLARYGTKTTIAHTFIDLWNLSDWQAKDFTRALKEKIDELLS